jgi:hypothetical protein
MSPLLIAGCSMFGGKSEPAVTGSLAAPVQVQQPLPSTLAYSDANKIGQAAAAALWQADAVSSGDWVNNATGSSGTVQERDLGPPQAAGDCRNFSTIVTSIGGVHSYSGDVCRSGGGRPVVRIDERAAEDRT